MRNLTILIIAAIILGFSLPSEAVERSIFQVIADSLMGRSEYSQGYVEKNKERAARQGEKEAQKKTDK